MSVVLRLLWIPSFAQIAGAAAFDCKVELEQHIHKYAENRRVLLQVEYY
jgi:hypothetical protein